VDKDVNFGFSEFDCCLFLGFCTPYLNLHALLVLNNRCIMCSHLTEFDCCLFLGFRSTAMVHVLNLRALLALNNKMEITHHTRCIMCSSFDKHSATLRKTDLMERVLHADLKELQNQKQALLEASESQARTITASEIAAKKMYERRSCIKVMASQLEQQAKDLEISIDKLNSQYENLISAFERRASLRSATTGGVWNEMKTRWWKEL
jgi:hypothetical protein